MFRKLPKISGLYVVVIMPKGTLMQAASSTELLIALWHKVEILLIIMVQEVDQFMVINSQMRPLV